MDNSDSEFAAVVEQLTERVLSGDPADVEEFIQQFPRFAPELRNMLSTLSALAHWKGEKSATALAADDDLTPLPSDRELGDFRILRELGRGGMGVVYEAEQISLQRRVALKVLPFASLISEKQLRRFKNEALAAASLKHPNIVDVYGTGYERSVHYYAMQLVEGCDLSRVIRRLQGEGRESVGDPAATVRSKDVTTETVAQLSTQRDASRSEFYRSVAALGVQVANALHFAHEEGVVHRDIKPANLLLDNTGKIHVADFGLARIRLDGDITLTGDVVGTLRYMSPEQVEGRVVDHRTDIYSLGATLYEMLTAKSLFHDEQNRAQLMAKIVDANPTQARYHDSSIPTDLATVIHKCLKYSADERYTTAKKLAEDLQRFLDLRPIRARRSSVFSAAYRWARRNRRLAVVSLVAVTAIALLALVGPLAAIRLNQTLINERQFRTQLARSHSDAEMQLYDMRMRNALDAVKRGEFAVAQNVLASYDSTSADGNFDRRSFEYWLLKSKVDHYQQSLIGTSGIDIQAIAVSPDGGLVAYGDWLGSITVVNAKSSQIDRVGELGNGFEKTLTHVCEFSPDGKYLLVAGGTKTKIWDVQKAHWLPLDGAEANSRNSYVIGGGFVLRGEQLAILIVDQDQPYSHDNTSNATLSIYELDVETELPRFELVARQNTGTVDRFSKSRAVAYAATLGAKEIRRWRLPNLEPMDVLRLNSSQLDKLAAHPIRDDALAVAYSEDLPDQRQTRVELISSDTGRFSRVLATNSEGIGCLKFSPDGTTLVAGFRDGQAWLWRDCDVQQGEGSIGLERRQIHGATVQDVAFGLDMQCLYTASSDQTARQTDVANSDIPNHIPVLGYTAAIEWTGNGQQLIVAGKDRVSVWDVRKQVRLLDKPLTLPVDSVNYVRDVCLLSDGQRVAFVANAWPASQFSRVGVWNMLTDETTWMFESERQANEVKQTSDGSVLVAAVGSQMLAFSTDDLQLTREQTFSPRCSIGMHPHKNFAAVSGRGETREQVRGIVIWDIDRWAQVGEIPMPESSGIDAITFSPDGNRLAADIGNGRIAIWHDWQDHNTAPIVLLAQADIAKLAFTPDGRRLASADWDGKVRLWNCDTGNEIVSVQTTAQWAISVAFNNDGTSLAFGGGIGTKYGAVHFLHAPRKPVRDVQ